jgi:hypothetical protein
MVSRALHSIWPEPASESTIGDRLIINPIGLNLLTSAWETGESQHRGLLHPFPIRFAPLSDLGPEGRSIRTHRLAAA